MTDIARTCIKISLLGDQAVGKTCICSTFFGLEFMENTLTSIGIEKNETKMKLENGKEIKVKIWDTAGQERFKSISLSTIKNSQGVLVVFDVTSTESFKHVTEWLKKIKDQKENIAIVLMGNKFDLPNRTVTKEEAEEFAKKNKLSYFESSAKLNKNIQEAFAKVVNEAYKLSSNAEGNDLNNNAKKKKTEGGCFGSKKKKQK
jgi:Ras-related protein Rab-1A